MADVPGFATIIFQADTRPPGVLCERTSLTTEEKELIPSAMFFHNFNRQEANRVGFYLFFNLDAPSFKDFSMYWLCGVLFYYLQKVFERANIHYIDSDACCLLDATEHRLDLA